MEFRIELSLPSRELPELLLYPPCVRLRLDIEGVQRIGGCAKTRKKTNFMLRGCVLMVDSMYDRCGYGSVAVVSYRMYNVWGRKLGDFAMRFCVIMGWFVFSFSKMTFLWHFW